MCWFLSSSARRSGGPALIAVVVLLLALWAGTALAHSDEGEMEITRFEQRGAESVELEVGVVYASDGHQAVDAQVSAMLSGPDGAALGPVELEPASDNGSLFAATIAVPPGSWNAQVTSTSPDATATGSIEVTAPAETPTTTAAAPASAETSPSTTVVEAEGVDGETAAPASNDDDGRPTGLLLTLGVVAVAIVGGGAFLASRRRGDAIE